MKAVVLEGPGQAGIKQVHAPEEPGNGEVLLKVRMVGLCGAI
jgi:threonine dehydrogenase-like Zn-dependent dehydrogenase